jgi:hypothetical protein
MKTHVNIADGVTTQEARKLGKALGVDFSVVDVEEFRRGMEVEREHADVTTDPEEVAKIALAHLRELPDYYTRLARIEGTALASKLRAAATKLRAGQD